MMLTSSVLAAAPASAAFGLQRGSGGNLIERLEADGRFDTLLFALEETGLDAALSGREALTVFAPTDDAFAALPDDVLDALLADPVVLSNVLLYHVAPGRHFSWRLLYNSTTTTLQGDPVLVLRGVDSPTINGSSFDALDRRASNGVFHVIDDVLLPPEAPFDVSSLVDVLAFDGRFSTLIALVTAAGLADLLTIDGPFTVFAPTDDAFAALPPETIDALLEDVGALTDILLYHVVDGRKGAFRLYREKDVETLIGASVSVTYANGALQINDSTVINPNVNTPNGFVHVIDELLLPPTS